MKQFVFLSFVFLTITKCFAQTKLIDSLGISVSKDSITQYSEQSNTHNSKEWFMQKYGDDQNSRDIIDFYFFRYKDYKKFPLQSLYIIVPSIAAIAYLNNNPDNETYLRPLGYLIFSSFILVAVGGVIYTKLNVYKYDNEHLKIILEEYHSTRVFPTSIKRNDMFYKTLKLVRKNTK